MAQACTEGHQHPSSTPRHISLDPSAMAVNLSTAPTSEITKQYCKLEESDPLLMENPRRFVMFPIQYPEVWEMYKKHEASFWTAEEIDLSADNKDWDELNDQERHFIKGS